MRFLTIITVLATLLRGTAAHAADKPITIIGRANVTVTSPYINLADVADVSAKTAHLHDDAIVTLKQIPIAASPQPGKTKEVTAQELLQILRAHQVNFENIGYAFPTAIRVLRASRSVKQDEIRTAIDEALTAMETGESIVVKDLVKSEPIDISPTMVGFSAEVMGVPHQGRLSFTVTASSPDGDKQVFPVQAYVEEWGQVPLTKRPIQKGEVITVDDVAMARLNLQAVPRDAIRKSDAVIGLETSQDIGYGDFFRSKTVGIPALVKVGDKVAAVVRSSLLEVTLKATSLDAASLGGEIRLRNDTSKKILRGKVVGEKLVEVMP